jgi:hypothetical protein
VSKLQSPRFWFWLAIILLIPIHAYSVAWSPWFFQLPKPIGDGPEYENIGFHVWQERGFYYDNQAPEWRQPYAEHAEEYAFQLNSLPRALPATGRPPGLPLLIAFAYATVGRNEAGYALIRMALACCTAVAGALATASTAQLLLRRVSVIPAACGSFTCLLLFASNRTLKTYSEDFLTEPMALLLTQVLVTLLVHSGLPASSASLSSSSLRVAEPRIAFAESGQLSWRVLFLLGLTLSAMILTRSLFVLWLPGIFLLQLVAPTHSGAFSKRLGRATCLVLIAAAGCAPWWIRNCIQLQRWMPLGTQGSITLVGGYCDEAYAAGGDWQFAPELQLRSEVLLSQEYQNASNDLEREVIIASRSRTKVREWIGSHTSQLPSLALQRIGTHWNPYTGASLIWKLLLVVGAGWLARIWLRDREPIALWLIGLPLLSTCVAALIYTTGGRFLIPLYGLLFLLSGHGMAWFAKSIEAVRNPAPNPRS